MSTPAANIGSADATPSASIPLRFVTAASLFDGHDASINIMRRILQSQGVEVVHLGHNRSVAEIVNAAVQEDVNGIAVSSYQGGHVEYFEYMIDSLKALGAGHIPVFGGGGGVIIPDEIQRLHDYGVAKIYSPSDGQKLGLVGMIEHMVTTAAERVAIRKPDLAISSADAIPLFTESHSEFGASSHRSLATLLTAIENNALSESALAQLEKSVASMDRVVPVLGITGTGGAGKSSVTDEFIQRLRFDQGESVSAVLIAIDPTRRKSGGALLGDRIRMNAIDHESIFMRSIATRDASGEVKAMRA